MQSAVKTSRLPNFSGGTAIGNKLPILTPTVVSPVLSDAEVDRKIKERFQTLEMLTSTSLGGSTRSLVVSGPPGLGKSFTIEKMLEEWGTDGEDYEIVKGFSRATGIYKILYKYRNEGQVIVFDDCDSVFGDEVGLNLLKSALDTTERRIIQWRAEIKMEDENGDTLPQMFEFKGSVIFISNMDFDGLIASGNRLAPHLEAIIDRSFYIDLELKTRRDFYIRIGQVVGAGMLRNMGCSAATEAEIMKFTLDNLDFFRVLSLRTVHKMAQVAMVNPDWRVVARTTLLKQR
jgi:hypothetical protein